MIRNESDTAWKEILDAYFKDCIDYCLPELSKLIDWKRRWISLDKELQSLTKDTIAGKRLLDKLFKVYLKDGHEQWILMHVEIQGKKEDDFPKRMFTYAYRVYDKYQKPVVSCAILTDEQKGWRPNHYKVGLAGSFLSCEFLVIKLIDYHSKHTELEAASNPFASIILTQLAALEAKRKPDEQRKQIKFSLTKRLYEKGFKKTEVINIYKFISWLIGLPEAFEIEYINEVHRLEESKKMPYISFAERFAMEKGYKEGRKEGIEKEKNLVANRLLSEGVELAFIKKITGLSLAKIKELQKKKH
jgi:hypothetical protein